MDNGPFMSETSALMLSVVTLLKLALATLSGVVLLYAL